MKKDSIKEASITNTGPISDVDDGPRFMYGNQKTYRKMVSDLAKRMNREILDFLVGEEEFEDHGTEYPDGPHEAVSYFPVGDEGSKNSGTNYYNDVTTSKSYKDYSKWVNDLVKKLNRELVDSVLSVDEEDNLTK